jgi:hypothetical protein
VLAQVGRVEAVEPETTNLCGHVRVGGEEGGGGAEGADRVTVDLSANGTAHEFVEGVIFCAGVFVSISSFVILQIPIESQNTYRDELAIPPSVLHFATCETGRPVSNLNQERDRSVCRAERNLLPNVNVLQGVRQRPLVPGPADVADWRDRVPAMDVGGQRTADVALGSLVLVRGAEAEGVGDAMALVEPGSAGEDGVEDFEREVVDVHWKAWRGCGW